MSERPLVLRSSKKDQKIEVGTTPGPEGILKWPPGPRLHFFPVGVLRPFFFDPEALAWVQKKSLWSEAQEKSNSMLRKFFFFVLFQDTKKTIPLNTNQ